MMMGAPDIDPDDFKKGLRLLHSRSPESSDELKKLLDQYYSKKANNDPKRAKESIMNALNSLQSLNQTVKAAEQQDDSEATDIEDNEPSENSADNSSKCVVCHQNKNHRILECHECRLQYHPECHKPPVSKKDLNDPRLIWYCFKCKSGTAKKLAATKTALAKNAISGGSGKIHISAFKEGFKSSDIISKPIANPIKRPVQKISTSPIYGSIKTTNLSSQSTSVGGSSSYGSSNSISSNTSNLLEKRLAGVKKFKK